MKTVSRWRSERLQRDTTLVRWGTYGMPVLVFPTAGGDAEEIERWKMLEVLEPLLAEGKIKVFSCDSVAGQVWFAKDTPPHHRMWVQNQFHQYIKHEVVPAIRLDCQTPDIEIVAAGSSIGAFHAAAVVCRFPDLFSKALCMSGTYNLERFIETRDFTNDFVVSSPLHFLPYLGGEHLAKLQTRFLLIASGRGRAEDIGESWKLANALGRQGVPNRVDDWGPEWHHDWPTWRVMMPKYLTEWTNP